MLSSINKLPDSLSWDDLNIPISEFEDWILCVNGSALIQKNGKITIILIPSDLRHIQFTFDPILYGYIIYHEDTTAEVKVDGEKLFPNDRLLLKKQVKISADRQVKIYAERKPTLNNS